MKELVSMRESYYRKIRIVMDGFVPSHSLLWEWAYYV